MVTKWWIKASHATFRICSLHFKLYTRFSQNQEYFLDNVRTEWYYKQACISIFGVIFLFFILHCSKLIRLCSPLALTAGRAYFFCFSSNFRYNNFYAIWQIFHEAGIEIGQRAERIVDLYQRKSKIDCNRSGDDILSNTGCRGGTTARQRARIEASPAE